MRTTEQRSSDAAGTPSVGQADMKLEVVTIPVSDIDRATEFYRRLGWRQDVTPPGVIQFTPPGSACSVQFGPNRTSDANWLDWYAAYMVAEQAGTELPR
jgi:catechol 2,3-dioxygenase-like lactoylglutathione lyase family enzyme